MFGDNNCTVAVGAITHCHILLACYQMMSANLADPSICVKMSGI